MSKTKIIYIKLCLSAFFWGGSAIAGKILLKEMSPLSVTFMRFFWATIILFFVCKFNMKTMRISLTLKEHLALFLMGFVGISLCYCFYFQGLNISSAFNASLMEATIPLCTLFISVAIKKETFTKNTLSGALIAYLGVFIIITKLNLHIIYTLNFNIGDIFLLISTLCFGIYNVLYRNIAPDIPSIAQTFYIFLYGTIGIIPWILYYMYSANYRINTHNFSIISVCCVIFLSLGSSVLAYLFFNQGIQVLGASKASIFINYVPIITILLSIIILSYIPAITQIIGSIVVLTGVYISQRNSIHQQETISEYSQK
ncbi:DMT family transporter [Clostridium kluyveri]|uniref:EamA domain-containing protein n=1 Tax=Clostridium kluyveri TaxID=1534 RepID=A0A1L5F8G0_CLOKL|nr:DMT family transporter [Clostridium kluyveri]APM39100.1 hypothetical protein BS101_10260 [Clostridium kluyveri]